MGQMKLISGLAGVLCAVAVAGCATPANLHTADADLARQVIAQHCVIGLRQDPSEWLAFDSEQLRLGKVSKRIDGLIFRALHRIDIAGIHIHGIQDRADGWMVVDASSDGVRDNLYLNRATGEFACSIDEWRAVREFPNRFAFEKSPLVGPGSAEPPK